MTDAEKIAFADRLFAMIKSENVDENIPYHVGELNKSFGLNGFKVATPGHPVFKLKDRYIIYLESLLPERNTGLYTVGVTFYIQELHQWITPR